MILLTLAVSVGLLVALIAVARFQPFVAFIVASLTCALLLGLPLARMPAILERGIGDMLGPLVTILGLGVLFGKVIADSGAAERIAHTLVAASGRNGLSWALAATGLLTGIPLFYNVGFVVMAPLIFSVAATTGRPVVYVGIPLLAGLSIAHGFLPPHPSPLALVTQFHADLGLTLAYGLIVAVPTLVVAGPLLATTLKGMPPTTPLFSAQPRQSEPPGALVSFASALLPVIWIGAAAILLAIPSLPPDQRALVAFLGHPMVVMLGALVVAMAVLGKGQRGALAAGQSDAIRDVAGVLLIIAGAGALKEVLIEGGTNDALGHLLTGLSLSPLLLGWLVAAIVRIALGSATVAGLTAATLVQPALVASGANPNLMVLAIGAGSLMCSHVNDSGFWLFKQYFGLDLRRTFRSWSLMETVVGICGLVFTLLLGQIVGTR